MRAHLKGEAFPSVPWQGWCRELEIGPALGAGQEELLCALGMLQCPSPTPLTALLSDKGVVKPLWD